MGKKKAATFELCPRDTSPGGDKIFTGYIEEEDNSRFEDAPEDLAYGVATPKEILELGYPDDLEELLCESSSTSSFGYSMCARDGDDDDDGEDEAQSMLTRDYPLHETFDDGTEFLGLRKKKVTDQWRKFSHPLAWRCKWVELKVKEILSQARGYDKEVKSYSETKDFDFDKFKWDGLEGNSIPLPDQTQRVKVFKRGRRKRVEETTGVAAYRSSHSIFSYADKRMQAAGKALDSDFGTGRKAMTKEDGTEDDCLVSELDCSVEFLPRLLCKIEEAQERIAGLKNRVDQLMMEAPTVPTSSTSEMISPCQRDLRAQNGKQRALVEESLMAHTAARDQKEAIVQIGRQRISADHSEHLMVLQSPPIEIGVQCLYNSPRHSGDLRSHPILEDLLMDEPDMNDDEIDMDDRFRKVMNDITGMGTPEESDADEDPTPVNKRLKTSD